MLRPAGRRLNLSTAIGLERAVDAHTDRDTGVATDTDGDKGAEKANGAYVYVHV